MHVRLLLPPESEFLRPLLRTLQVVLFLLGVVSVCAFGWLQVERFYFGRQYLQEFERMAAAEESFAIEELPGIEVPRVEIPSATAASPAVLANPPAQTGSPVLARLRIERLGLDAPVLDGVDDRTLRRGAGWIPGTARPGESGNVGIAAHRDTFFRPLRGIQSGDRIELDLPGASHTYVVKDVYVVEPGFEGALQPTTQPALTLVTCFPFNFVGAAPRRYIVRAALAGD